METEITIIIPTFERHDVLKKFLAYWMALNVKVIVVDGSARSLFGKEEKKSIQNVDYYHLPISIEERLNFASQKIKGKYGALISDDEILVYSGLLEASKILENNKKVGSVLGATLAFKQYNDKIVFKVEYESALQLKIDGGTCEKRIDQRMQITGNSICYPLVRTEILKKALALIGEYKYTCPYISEYQMEVMLCAAAHVKVIPVLMWLRNRNGEIVSNEEFNRKILFHEWIIADKNDKEKKTLADSFERHLKFSCKNEKYLREQLILKISEFEKKSLGVISKESEERSNWNNYIKKLEFLKLIKTPKLRNKSFFWETIEDIKDDLNLLGIHWNQSELNSLCKLLRT